MRELQAAAAGQSSDGIDISPDAVVSWADKFLSGGRKRLLSIEQHRVDFHEDDPFATRRGLAQISGVESILISGRTPQEVADELAAPLPAVHRWLKEYEIGGRRALRGFPTSDENYPYPVSTWSPPPTQEEFELKGCLVAAGYPNVEVFVDHVDGQPRWVVRHDRADEDAIPLAIDDTTINRYTTELAQAVARCTGVGELEVVKAWLEGIRIPAATAVSMCSERSSSFDWL